MTEQNSSPSPLCLAKESVVNTASRLFIALLKL